VSRRPPVRVTSAAESAALDQATIAAGVPSRALMQRAGGGAAAAIARRFAARLARGVAIFAGPGNNGGDGWVVARAFAAAGIRVTVVPVGDARTDDARAERALAQPLVETEELHGGEALVVDALLGTGASGAPRGDVAGAIATIAALRGRGAAVVLLDVPSGVDATTGAADGAVRADLTITFGSMKRGLLVARAHAGETIVLDIGLLDDRTAPGPRLVDAAWALSRVPPIAADAHKGTRGRVLVIGGAPGMAGAAVLAARAAQASGAGMTKLLVAPDSLPAAQAAAPAALAGAWPASPDELEPHLAWADAVLLGPGLGRSADAERLLALALERHRGPVVLDADALNAFAGRAPALAGSLDGRPAVLTPHPAEFARLTSRSVEETLAQRFDAGASLAAAAHAIVLLKGVPTVVSDAGGPRWVSGAGSPVLAAAGSGDLLGGVAATLLAQGVSALDAAAVSAWAHGRAGELAAAGRRTVRGATLDDVCVALGRAWTMPDETMVYPVLAALPRAGDP
jgi:NAD(P)H-hydrate epimerase